MWQICWPSPWKQYQLVAVDSVASARFKNYSVSSLRISLPGTRPTTPPASATANPSPGAIAVTPYHSYANIEYVGGESRCPAVAWPLSAEEVADLDVPEGATGKDGTFDYYRIGMPFVMKAGARLCHVYIANPDRLQRPAPPAAHYHDHFRLGYEEFGLDSRHLEEALARASHPTNLLFGDSVRCKEQP